MIRKTCIFFLFLLLFKSSFNQVDIGGYDSLLLWLNGSNVELNSQGIFQINDNGPNNNYAYTNETNRQPTIISTDYTINNHPKILFDGINDYMRISNESNPEIDFSLFLVVKPNTFSGPHGIFSRSFSNRRFQFRFNNSSFDSWVNNINQSSQVDVDTTLTYLISITYDGQNRLLNINGNESTILPQSGPITYVSSDPTVLGCVRKAQSWSATHFFDGYLMELVLFGQALDTAETNEIKVYLANKYAPPVDLGNDITIDYGFCDISLSSPSYYNTYLWSTDQLILQ